MVQYGPKLSKYGPKKYKIVQNSSNGLKWSNIINKKKSRWFKMLQYGPKWSKMVQNGPKQSKIVLKSPKLYKWCKMVQNVVKFSKKRVKMVQNGPKLSKIIQHFQQFKMSNMVHQIFKMVQYGPNSSKVISQKDRSWCDTSWGNSSQKQI